MIYSFSTDLKQHKAIHVQTVTAPLYRRPNTALPGRTASTVAHKRHMHRNAAMLVHAEITGNGGFYTLQQLLKRHALCSLPLFTSHLCSVLRDCNGSRVSYQPMVMSRTCSLLLEAQHRKQPKQEHSPLSPLKRIPETPGPALPRARQARLHGRADRHPHGRPAPPPPGGPPRRRRRRLQQQPKVDAAAHAPERSQRAQRLGARAPPESGVGAHHLAARARACGAGHTGGGLAVCRAAVAAWPGLGADTAARALPPGDMRGVAGSKADDAGHVRSAVLASCDRVLARGLGKGIGLKLG